jgi:hypothetical protein
LRLKPLTCKGEVAHESTPVGWRSTIPEPLFTWPAARREAHGKRRKSKNYDSIFRVGRPSGLAKANCMGSSVVTS